MKELSTGQSIKQMITNKDWWKGVFGNMLSTIIGIGLTIGIGALVQLHNDRSQAREMMMQVITTCEDDGFTIHNYDSIFNVHKKATMELVRLYIDHGKDIEKIPLDSLQKYVGILSSFKETKRSRTSVDAYFFSAQMMHQFGNAKKYSKFAEFVKQDQLLFEKITQVKSLWDEQQAAFNRLTWDDPEIKTGLQAFQKMMEEHYFTNYYNAISDLELGQEVAWFKYEKGLLLKLAGVTEEEYKEYKESQRLEEINGSKFKYSHKDEKVVTDK